VISGNRSKQGGNVMSNRSLMFIVTIVFFMLSGLGHADGSCWRTCQNETEALCRDGDWSQAFQRGKEAVKLARKNYGASHLNTAKSLEKLGDICAAWGKLQQSNLFLEEALRIRSGIHGECHPSVIKLLTMMAGNFSLHRENDRAEELYRKALQLADKEIWGQSSYAAPALEGLARLDLNRGQTSSAESLYQRALAAYEMGSKYVPGLSLCEARCLLALADIKREKGDFRNARDLYEDAVHKYASASGPTSPMIALTYKRLADLHADKGMHSLALTYFQRSLGAHERTGLPEGLLTAATLAGMANLLKSKGQHDKAKNLYGNADKIYTRTGGFDRELATMVLTKERIWPAR